jgi:hypothetical protein
VDNWIVANGEGKNANWKIYLVLLAVMTVANTGFLMHTQSLQKRGFEWSRDLQDRIRELEGKVDRLERMNKGGS